jgi:hypothetical protein
MGDNDNSNDDRDNENDNNDINDKDKQDAIASYTQQHLATLVKHAVNQVQEQAENKARTQRLELEERMRMMERFHLQEAQDTRTGFDRMAQMQPPKRRVSMPPTPNDNKTSTTRNLRRRHRITSLQPGQTQKCQRTFSERLKYTRGDTQFWAWQLFRLQNDSRRRFYGQ